MIDIKAARANPDAYLAALNRKDQSIADRFDTALRLDAQWRARVPEVDALRARMKLKGKPTPEQLQAMQGVKAELTQLEGELRALEFTRDEVLKEIPNPPHPSVPDGDTEEDAVELRRVGEPPAIADPKEHTEIGRFDMERAAKVSGSRFGYLIGDTALVALALYRLALDRLGAAGFLPVIPPVLVREEAMEGTGFFPTERSNIYALDGDPLFLTGTSEVALAGLHMGEILDGAELPLRYAGFSTNFRREAGAAGKDTRGMIRVHQFNKVEMYSYVHPDESWNEHERILELEESILRELELPYRVVNIAAGDLGASAAKKYDCEAWFPAQGRYREVTSASNTTDFQARRLRIRFRGDRGTDFVHTLNGTAVTDRALLAILENFQGEVPDALRSFGAPSRVSR
jgi:seryl-tRNA synthetase